MEGLDAVVLVSFHYEKHAYSNIQKISPPKNLNFSDKNSDIFFIFLLKT